MSISASKLGVSDTLSSIDACCLSVSGIYEAFTKTLYGEFKTHTGFGSNNTSPKRFYESAIKSQRQFQSIIQNQLVSDLDSIELTLEAGVKRIFKKTKMDTARRLMVAYRSQMLQDIQAARLDVLRYTLAINQKLKDGQSIESSVVGVSKTIRFKFVDRLGRRWNSDRYMVVVTRFELVKSIFFAHELLADTLGAEQFLMSNGDIVNLSDAEKFTHPNTKSIPVQVVK